MNLHDYGYTNNFNDLARKLEKFCTKKFGSPTEIVINSDIYLFVFITDNVRIVMDSSEAYDKPENIRLFLKVYFKSKHLSQHMEAFRLHKCNLKYKEIKSFISTYGAGPNRLKEFKSNILVLTAIGLLLVTGLFSLWYYALKAYIIKIIETTKHWG